MKKLILSELKNIRPGKQMDKLVYDNFYDSSKKMLNYSTNRSHAAILLYDLLFRLDKYYLDRFEKILTYQFKKNMKFNNIKPMYSYLIIWATPDVICKAALYALTDQRCNQIQNL